MLLFVFFFLFNIDGIQVVTVLALWNAPLSLEFMYKASFLELTTLEFSRLILVANASTQYDKFYIHRKFKQVMSL